MVTTTPPPATITIEEFTSTLDRYTDTIAKISEASSQMTLQELDFWRLNTLPQTVQSRKKPHLTKDELRMLLSCKMERGKRRQALPKLIESNTDNTVRSATTAAFDYIKASNTTPPSTEHILAALKILVDPLKGVGPATASYILAVTAPDTVPAFSDEGYKWALYKRAGKGTGGWDRKIKYDVKEYRIYVDNVKALVARLGDSVTAGDVERVGFVLGKEGMEFRAESSATIVEASKNIMELDTLDRVLGLEGGAGLNSAFGQVMAMPAPPVTGPSRLNPSVPTTNKRKKPTIADSNGSNTDTDEILPPRSRRKTKAPAPKKGNKMGGASIGKH